MRIHRTLAAVIAKVSGPTTPAANTPVAPASTFTPASVPGAGVNGARAALAKAYVQGQAALPKELATALVTGVSTRRTAKAEGSEGWLGVAHVRNFVTVFSASSATDRSSFQKAFAAAKPQQQWVLLKAAAARGLKAATSFATKIAPLSPAQLLVRTTLIDLDQADRKNSGLAQRWSGSCVPTSMQIALGEADPIFAFDATTNVLNDGAARDALATQEKQLLEGHGGVAVGRDAKGGAGIAYADIAKVAAELLGAATKEKFDAVSLDYLPPAQRQKRLQLVAALLEDGRDVPVTIPGHCMLLTDTRVGTDQVRRFLLQDPWAGTSLWVTESQLARDSFDLANFASHTNLNNLYLPS
ncbi:MAG: hypothetical protein U0228_00830 [Myxococcaceae bacterium]